jgi:molybdenum cofactor guanylyltransferase
MMQQPLGVILAGGLATRMGGGDKGRLMLGGQSLLGRVIDRFEPQVAGLALNANGDAARFADLGLPVLADSVADFPGPLAGVLAGLDWAAEIGAAHIVTAAADTPFLPPDLVPQLLLAAERENSPIALAATADAARGVLRHPTFGLWPVDLRGDLRAALAEGLRKVVLWTDRHGAANAVFPEMPFDPFFNVNTAEDLARAERMLA